MTTYVSSSVVFVFVIVFVVSSANIKLCFKMACLLGIAQASLVLLSLRCCH